MFGCGVTWGCWVYSAGVDVLAEGEEHVQGRGIGFGAVPDRGPLALHALRKEMGEDAFFALLKGRAATFEGKNATFDDLETYASTLLGN